MKVYREKEVINLIEGQKQKIITCQKRIDEANKIIEELTPILAELQIKKEVKRARHEKQQNIKKADTHNYCGKILYPSEDYAERVRKQINRDLQKANKDPLMRSYFCAACEAWHLTSVPHWVDNHQSVLEKSEGANSLE